MRDELTKDFHSTKGGNSTASGKNGRNISIQGGGSRNGDLPSPSAFAAANGHDSFDDSRDPNNDNYAEFEQQQQLRILNEQDQELDQVFSTVGNLRAQADVMGRELEEQSEMLNHVDGLTDRVAGRLETGLQKMSYVIKKNEDTASSCCIGVLIFVLILLLVLVIIL